MRKKQKAPLQQCARGLPDERYFCSLSYHGQIALTPPGAAHHTHTHHDIERLKSHSKKTSIQFAVQ
jgi:hypothetical protein